MEDEFTSREPNKGVTLHAPKSSQFGLIFLKSPEKENQVSTLSKAGKHTFAHGKSDSYVSHFHYFIFKYVFDSIGLTSRMILLSVYRICPPKSTVEKYNFWGIQS